MVDKMHLLLGFLIILLPVPTLAQEIAITIDDAPRADSKLFSGEERTQTLIANLQKANVSDALLFVITSNITEKSKSRIEAYAQAGFHLGNHSHNHFSANRTDPEAYIADITLAHDELSDFENVISFYRYPYLHEGGDRKARDRIRQHLQNMGYKNGYVTVDNHDWYMDSLLQEALANGTQVNYESLKNAYITILWDAISFYDDIAQKSLGRSPRHVLLLHENDITALYIGELIEHIRSQGWEIISPQKAYEDPIASTIPDVLYNGQGRVAAIAKSKGWDEKSLRNNASSKDYLDAYFRNNNVYGTPEQSP